MAVISHAADVGALVVESVEGRGLLFVLDQFEYLFEVRICLEIRGEIALVVSIVVITE